MDERDRDCFLVLLVIRPLLFLTHLSASPSQDIWCRDREIRGQGKEVCQVEYNLQERGASKNKGVLI